MSAGDWVSERVRFRVWVGRGARGSLVHPVSINEDAHTNKMVWYMTRVLVEVGTDENRLGMGSLCAYRS